MFVSGLLLAAGASSRFGSPKMLAEVSGEPLLLRSARVFLDAGFDETVVVLGAHADTLASVIRHLPVRIVLNGDWHAGMFSSVRAGLRELDPSAERVAVSPADLPGLSAADVKRVLAASLMTSEEVLTVPVCGVRRGHPLVFSTRWAPRILSWGQEARLSDLFRQPDLTIHPVDGFGEGVLHDVDRPSDLALLPEIP